MKQLYTIRYTLYAIILFSILYSLFSINASPVFAEDIQQNFIEAIAGDGYNRQKHDFGVTNDLMNTIIVAVGGMPIENPDGTGYKREGGAISVINDLTATLYSTQPASSVEYLADVASNLGLAKPAYAQGMGWTAFSPVLGLWKIFRNIAYLGFVIIFVVIGFMIMFRAKINPQTVISIQNALPRIIVTLLLITFSYAIAGFIVDLMSLSIRLLLKVIVPTMNVASQQKILNEDIFSLVHPIGTGSIDKITSAVGELDFWGEAGIAEDALRFIGWVTIAVVFAISAFFIMFKIFFMLLGSYISIILAVIFAPIWLLLGALPGNNALGGWLKGLISDILVFPATFIMLLLAAIFQAIAEYETGVWNIPDEIRTSTQIPRWAPPLIGTGWGEVIAALISFGILFTIPAVGAAIKQMFEIKPSPMGGRAMEEIRARLGWVPLVGGTLERAGI